MFFDAKEFLIEREDLGRLRATRRCELAFSMSQDFVEVSGHLRRCIM